MSNDSRPYVVLATGDNGTTYTLVGVVVADTPDGARAAARDMHNQAEPNNSRAYVAVAQSMFKVVGYEPVTTFNERPIPVGPPPPDHETQQED